LEAFAATASDDDVGSLLPSRIPAPGRLHLSYAGTFSLVGKAIEACGGIQAMLPEQRVRLARDFQTAAIAQLEEKIVLALRACELKGEGVQHVIVSGGVASNSYLRKRLSRGVGVEFPEVKFAYPPPALCTGELPAHVSCYSVADTYRHP
jgi:N6-L-threonylcarbamoyladenine synthase